MTKSIITENITAIQYNELREFMQNCIKESINSLDSHDVEHIAWYEDCSMDDYFTMWTEIWDNDTMVGEGLDTIAHKFILNDDTRSDFENAFKEARDAAYEEKMEEIAEEIEEMEDCDFQTIDIDDEVNEEEQRLIDNNTYTLNEVVASHINEACSKLEKEGYKMVVSDSDETTIFENTSFCYNLIEKNVSVDKLAKWLGAEVLVNYQGSDNFDYMKHYFKK